MELNWLFKYIKKIKNSQDSVFTNSCTNWIKFIPLWVSLIVRIELTKVYSLPLSSLIYFVLLLCRWNLTVRYAFLYLSDLFSLSHLFHSLCFPLSHFLLSIVLSDLCNQDWKSFIGDTGKLLCLRSEISCAWTWDAM